MGGGGGLECQRGESPKNILTFSGFMQGLAFVLATRGHHFNFDYF